jgi:hypothetical protein
VRVVEAGLEFDVDVVVVVYTKFEVEYCCRALPLIDLLID